MKVTATGSAEEAVRKVRASGRDDLVMVLSSGCCDSTAPFLYDRYIPEADSEQVGEIEDVPIMAPAWLRRLYDDENEVAVDVVTDASADSFSLETDLGYRFVLRAPGNSGLG